ncbi:hypothetical protein N8920_02860 [Opitutales bacterium]|jgi:hypothetical protein|nr:hypothetical protein [Opitutales bacterium]MDA8990314.1 hypothetical protein [Opitutales bacterium]
MEINDNHSLKDLERLKRKIEKQIEAKKTTKTDQVALYELIKKDHERHRREDGRKVFRGVVDYLECYINGLPPVAKSAFYNRFGIESKRGRVTIEVINSAKDLLAQGKTLAETAELIGVSTATCQKIKKGDYDS